MHEMPYTQALLDTVLEHADGRQVTDIYTQIGQLSSIVPESIESFFDFLSKGTLAQGASLHFEVVDLQLTCQECGSVLDTGHLAEVAPRQLIAQVFENGCSCGSNNLRITEGLGFEISSITVDED